MWWWVWCDMWPYVSSIDRQQRRVMNMHLIIVTDVCGIWFLFHCLHLSNNRSAITLRCVSMRHTQHSTRWSGWTHSRTPMPNMLMTTSRMRPGTLYIPTNICTCLLYIRTNIYTCLYIIHTHKYLWGRVHEAGYIPTNIYTCLLYIPTNIYTSRGAVDFHETPALSSAIDIQWHAL